MPVANIDLNAKLKTQIPRSMFFNHLFDTCRPKRIFFMKKSMLNNPVLAAFWMFVLSCFCFPQNCPAYQAGTHTWIALQALKLVDNPDLQDPTLRNEVVLGSWEADTKFYNDAIGNPYDDTKWVNDAESAPRDHFYNPDTGDALCGCRELANPCWTAKAKADQYWNLAIDRYNSGDKRTAYIFLGHAAHLLADMAVPAHVLDDPHPVKDSYEDYMENMNYTKWGFKIVSSIRTASTIGELFDALAQRTQYFPSNDKDGNQANADVSWFVGWPSNPNDMRNLLGLPCPDIPLVCGDTSGCGIADDDLERIGGKLIPLAIEYSAALYNLFYEQFNVSISGPSVVPALYNGLDFCPLFASAGRLNGLEPDHWEWDLNYDGTFEADPRYSGQPIISPDPLDFKTRGTKRIAVKAKVTAQAIEKIAEKTITVTQYPIKVEAPNGYEDLYRKFSTPENSLIQTYSWNYGDGSPVEEGSSHGNTFPTSGYYTVTLTLTLDDGSTIQSEAGIFVGPGTRYIQSHAIYGDETWYGGGTYFVSSPIWIAEGGSLTIEPGATVKVIPNSSVPFWDPDFNVYGTLRAVGATFTAAEDENGWNGILFEGSGASNSRLENCVVEKSWGFPFYYDPSMESVWSNIIIHNASPTITGCTFNNNSLLITNGSPEITGSTFNQGLIDVFMNAFPVVTGNTITNSSKGIAIGENSAGVYRNNTIAGMTDFGIDERSNLSPVVTDNFISSCGVGIYISTGTCTGNTLTNNEYGASVWYKENLIFSGNSYASNSKADIQAGGTIKRAVVWGDGGDNVYEIPSGLNIAEGGSLTIKPGGRTVKIYGYSDEYGYVYGVV